MLEHDESKRVCDYVMQSVTATTFILAIFDINQDAERRFGVPESVIELINKLKAENKKVIVVLFGTPYAVSLFKSADAIVVAYEDDEDAQIAAANVLLGHKEARGILPVSLPLVVD
jgi:hypothetical protein